MDNITIESELDALYEAPGPTSILKEIGHITDDYRKFIEASPFAILATLGLEGGKAYDAEYPERMKRTIY